MSANLFTAAFVAAIAAAGGRDEPCVHLTAGALRGALPKTGRAARLAPAIAAQARRAGELGLDGWLSGDVLVLTDAGEKEAAALLARVAAVEAEVGRCCAKSRAAAGDAPLVLFHVRAWATYGAVVDALAASFPDERDFLRSMRDGAGFELTTPGLRAVCVDALAPARSNLLVHLAAHACLDRAVDGAPGWLIEGLALEVETRLCGAPAAFCGGGAREPAARTSSERRLARELACRDDAAWAATFALPGAGGAEPAAWRALGVVRWLLRRRDGRFGDVVGAAAAAEAAARADGADAAERSRRQLRALADVLGEGWRTELRADGDATARAAQESDSATRSSRNTTNVRRLSSE